MMIFTVYITAYCATDRYKLGAGCYRKKPSFWNNYFKYFVERKSGLAFKSAINDVER